MPLGRPAIPNLATLQLQRLQQVVNNIRERFGASDAAILALQQGLTGGLSSATATTRSLQVQIDQLRTRVAALEAVTPDALSASFMSAEAISQGAPVWVSDAGAVSLIDPDSVLASSGFFGIAATTVVSAGLAVQVRLPGGVVEIPGSSFTVGRPLYAQLDGVTHFPAGNSLPVGVAISATEMAVGYGFNVLGDAAFDPLGQDDMALTYGLAQQSGVGGVLPVVTGEVPPVLVYLDDGSLVYSPLEA